MKLDIAKDYTKTPGGRYKKEGKYSGEEFRENYLKNQYETCKKTGEELTVVLDGGYGYGSSFLEEAFGGLARIVKDPDVLKIKIISNEEPRLIDDIRKYMEDALNV